MSVRNTLKAFPTLMRIGFIEALAYRTEMLVWVLATTMPLVMLALWTAVARDAPVGRFGQAEFVSYFLSTFIVRQLTGTWAAWQMNFEVRQGTLAMRLLRPVHPIFCYAVENLAAVPLRLVVAVPVAVVTLLSVGTKFLPTDGLLWLFWLLSIVGSWLIAFLANIAIGALSFFLQSSLKVMEVWLALFFLCSGYLFPLELLSPFWRDVLGVMPFRYMIGFPVELMNSHHGRAEALALLGVQWGWVAALGALCLVVWRTGLKRFSAFGG